MYRRGLTSSSPRLLVCGSPGTRSEVFQSAASPLEPQYTPRPARALALPLSSDEPSVYTTKWCGASVNVNPCAAIVCK